MTFNSFFVFIEQASSYWIKNQWRQVVPGTYRCLPLLLYKIPLCCETVRGIIPFCWEILVGFLHYKHPEMITQIIDKGELVWYLLFCIQIPRWFPPLNRYRNIICKQQPFSGNMEYNHTYQIAITFQIASRSEQVLSILFTTNAKRNLYIIIRQGSLSRHWHVCVLPFKCARLEAFGSRLGIMC